MSCTFLSARHMKGPAKPGRWRPALSPRGHAEGRGSRQPWSVHARGPQLAPASDRLVGAKPPPPSALGQPVPRVQMSTGEYAGQRPEVPQCGDEPVGDGLPERSAGAAASLQARSEAEEAHGWRPARRAAGFGPSRRPISDACSGEPSRHT